MLWDISNVKYVHRQQKAVSVSVRDASDQLIVFSSVSSLTQNTFAILALMKVTNNYYVPRGLKSIYNACNSLFFPSVQHLTHWSGRM